MTLSWQISIIDGLIRENPEATIRDYAILLKDLEDIEKQSDMGDKVTEEEREQILLAIETLEPKEVAKRFGRSLATIYRALRDAGYDIWAEKEKRKKAKWEADQLEKIYARKARLDEKVADIMETRTPAVVVVRAKGEYSNSGFNSVTQKYAS